jgi:hypothetical protein
MKPTQAFPQIWDSRRIPSYLETFHRSSYHSIFFSWWRRYPSTLIGNGLKIARTLTRSGLSAGKLKCNLTRAEDAEHSVHTQSCCTTTIFRSCSLLSGTCNLIINGRLQEPICLPASLVQCARYCGCFALSCHV